MSSAIQILVPPAGWAEFRDSPKVVDLLWQRFRAWLYMNHGGASIWEEPEHSGRTVYAAFQGEDIVELVVDSGAGSFAALLLELKDQFGLTPMIDSDGAA